MALMILSFMPRELFFSRVLGEIRVTKYTCHVVEVTSSSRRDSHECNKIRGHYRGAMLIHAHWSTTLSNDRKTEKTRHDLGAAPPAGPIKEGYPCTRWHAHCWAHVRTHAGTALLSFFFSPRIPYVSYDPLLHTGGVPLYEGFYRAPGVSPPRYLCACLHVRLWLPYALARMCHPNMCVCIYILYK